jgi:predicted dienelactone hydrolase
MYIGEVLSLSDFTQRMLGKKGVGAMRKDSFGIVKPKMLAGVIVAVFAFSFYAAADNGVPPDPGQPGPYAVGHTVYVFNDLSRQTTDSLYGAPTTIPRPVPVYVFYPVDPSSISASTPEAIYPLDPIHPLNPFIGSPLSYSGEWEQQGIDPAYQKAKGSADGPFPLVMVSHGWGGHAWTMLYLGPRLASHGFVVALVYHYGDAFWPWEEFDNVGVGLINRPLDVSFALTKLLEMNRIEGAVLHNLVDPDKIAASGFSFGGYVAAVLAAGDDEACDTAIEAGLSVPPETCVPVPADPRIRAILPLDGAHHFLRFSEMARITVPTMGIGEEWDAIPALGLPESWQARLHAASQGHPSYRVDITGTDHSSFSNMCEALPIYLSHRFPEPIAQLLLPLMQQRYCAAPLPPQEIKRLITKYAIAFLKTNLSGEPGYQSVLTSGYALTHEAMVEFFVTEKGNPQAIDKDWPDSFMYFMHQPGSERANALKDPIEVAPMPYMGFDSISK